MTEGPIGIIANPASGKDVRRLVSRASVFDNREKSAIVRRAIIGAVNAGARDFVYLDDSHNIVGSAIAECDADAGGRPVDVEISATARDTELAARQMQAMGCAVVLVLGGDGTSRAFARGWRDAPLIAVSTGTNNVFPVFAEATVAGAAAGLIASGFVDAAEVCRQCKLIDVEIEDEPADIALIDAVISAERFVGARALMNADNLRHAILSRAVANAVGISALGGLLHPLSDTDDCGLYLGFGAGEVDVHAPIAPGLYRSVAVNEIRELPLHERLELKAGGVLAFDGERERVIGPEQRITFSISRTGPAVVDIARALQLGASRGAYTTGWVAGADHAD